MDTHFSTVDSRMNTRLIEILRSRSERKAFRKYLESRYSEEIVDFWRDTVKYLKSSRGDCNVKERIVSTYIETGSEHEINISGILRKKILEHYKEGDVVDELLEKCVVEVETLMTSNFLGAYLMDVLEKEEDIEEIIRVQSSPSSMRVRDRPRIIKSQSVRKRKMKKRRTKRLNKSGKTFKSSDFNQFSKMRDSISCEHSLRFETTRNIQVRSSMRSTRRSLKPKRRKSVLTEVEGLVIQSSRSQIDSSDGNEVKSNKKFHKDLLKYEKFSFKSDVIVHGFKTYLETIGKEPYLSVLYDAVFSDIDIIPALEFYHMQEVIVLPPECIDVIQYSYSATEEETLADVKMTLVSHISDVVDEFYVVFRDLMFETL
eukprot:TRINITY_DN3584_c0_g1_i1.p1 TRINITY_DN3584_c0_g1~~TRINITY_DN3584_c0_g1_i1.p1  ORF type:complete len:372 (+),score=73.31 TRINITY_DN3584_c0_g1_i1:104-1219(+)